MKIHSDEKHFGCISVGKRITYKSNLKKHLKRHKGDNIFKCTEWVWGEICTQVHS